MIPENEYLQILKRLMKNINDHSSEPSKYILLDDLRVLKDYSYPNIRYRLKSLESKGMIALHKDKSERVSAVLLGNYKVYVPTEKAMKNYPTLGRNQQKNYQGGVRDTPKCTDIHDLLYTFKIDYIPEGNPYFSNIEPIVMAHDTKRYHKTILEPETNQRGSIDLYVGKRGGKTLTVKPFITQGDLIDDKLKNCDKLAYYIQYMFTRYGYQISLPIRKGEGKPTVLHPKLGEIPAGKYENFMVDESQGKKELHPKTGDLNTNIEMTKLFTEVGYFAQVSQKVNKIYETLETLSDNQQKLISILTPEQRDNINKNYEGYYHG